MQLLQEIRLHEPPVTADTLAHVMKVSERTIYRDVDTLRKAGAKIEGAAGYGFTLIESPELPPLSFSHEEIEALVLGLREVQAVADPALAKAAKHALAKLNGALPPGYKTHLQHAVLYAKRFQQRPKVIIDPAVIRKAAWNEQVIEIEYTDVNQSNSLRRIYPLSIVYLDTSLVLLSYCCLRRATRAFRLDRIKSVMITDETFRPRRVSLLRKAMLDVRNNS